MLANLSKRPRRLRKNDKVRRLVRETRLNLDSLVLPYFLSTGKDAKAKEPITGFTEIFRWGKETLTREIEADLEKGLSHFLLFGSSENKDAIGSQAYATNNQLAETVSHLKKRFGNDIVLITDVCLCPFTSHGHCGLVEGDKIINDSTVQLLGKMALTHAEAGVDLVAPSDMMDGRVGAIRRALDQKGYTETAILSYTAKYASSYYGPFREALESSPQGMDRKSHQMDWHNQKEALKELKLDIEEGADIVMVKPALAYLDIIQLFAKYSKVPVAAYSVSGEYEMVKQMAKAGMADEREMFLENLTAIQRAGASILITYAAKEIAHGGWLK